MKSKLSVHWNPVHNWPVELALIDAIKPLSTKIINPDVQQISDVHRLSPQTLVVLRDHARSEQHDNLANNPAAAGRLHAEETLRDTEKFEGQARERGIPFPPRNLLVGCGVNEPSIDAGPMPNPDGDPAGWQRWLDETMRRCEVLDIYEDALLRRATELGHRMGALRLSVGWPPNRKPDTPVVWEWFPRTYAALRADPGHFLMLHEYFDKRGPAHNWGWWCGRYRQCPWDVPIILAELGLDQYVADGVDNKEVRGWLANASMDQMWAWLVDLDGQMLLDSRIHSAQLYTSDGGKEWRTYWMDPLYSRWIEYSRSEAQPASAHWPIRFAAWPPVVAVRPKPVEKPTEYVTNLPVVGGTSSPPSPPSPVIAPSPVPSPAPTPKQPAEVSPGIIDPLVALAVIDVESGGHAFSNGRLVIRFESHMFRRYLADDNLWRNYFRADEEKPWQGQAFRTHADDAMWTPCHLGSQDFDANQRREWEVFELAAKINRYAALMAISMGAPQIMGFNHARIGYANPDQMMTAFSNGLAAQIVGFLNYVLGDPDLVAAIRRKDFQEIALRYNGSGNVGVYAVLLETAYQRVVGATP